MIPHAEIIYEKFKAKGLTETALRFERILNEGHGHLTVLRKYFLRGIEDEQTSFVNRTADGLPKLSKHSIYAFVVT